MRALQFATATVNLACQKAFLFLATHGPIFICLSSSSTLFQCGLQCYLWNCSPMPPLVVKMIGTKSMRRALALTGDKKEKNKNKLRLLWHSIVQSLSSAQ